MRYHFVIKRPRKIELTHIMDGRAYPNCSKVHGSLDDVMIFFQTQSLDINRVIERPGKALQYQHEMNTVKLYNILHCLEAQCSESAVIQEMLVLNM